MARPKRDGGTAKVQSLKDRSDAVMTGTTLQTVPLDEVTFSKVVSFQETEGCSLLEALRRAVRIGVEALLLDRTPVVVEPSPWGREPEKLPKFYSRTTMPGAQFEPAGFQSLLPTAEPEDSGPDYSVDAPPGL
jgi:hypothetical protein